ncbi:MAG: PD40 domain-containing protein [Anaerolineales bacterium]|nr:PD40 domain-containing protein [Anaerolineales bacterium]
MYNAFRGCWVGLLLFILIAAQPSAAQTESDLQGPLIAVNDNDDNGLVLFDLGTGQQRRLSFGIGEHILGDFSPDGCRLVFTWEQQPQRYNVYTVRIDGTDLQQLTDLRPDYRAWEPTWSPDGSRIAFTLMHYYQKPDEDEPERDSHIVWIAPEGGDLHYYSSTGKEWQPRWSPDGSALVYVSEQPVLPTEGTPTPSPEEEDDLPKKPEVWVTQADASSRYRLTNYADGPAFNPRWSPDGNRIAVLFQPYENLHRVMILDTNGTVLMALYRELVTVLDHTWLPDSQGMVVAIQGMEGIEQNVLWRFSFADDSRTLVFDTDTMLYNDFPRFSADGHWMALRRAYDLVIYDTQDQTTHLLPNQHNTPPVWSPSGFHDEATCR